MDFRSSLTLQLAADFCNACRNVFVITFDVRHAPIWKPLRTNYIAFGEALLSSRRRVEGFACAHHAAQFLQPRDSSHLPILAARTNRPQRLFVHPTKMGTLIVGTSGDDVEEDFRLAIMRKSGLYDRRSSSSKGLY